MSEQLNGSASSALKERRNKAVIRILIDWIVRTRWLVVERDSRELERVILFRVYH